jgi:hypothetical protein
MVCVCVLVALGLSAVARGSLRHTAVCLSHVRFLQTTLSTDTCGVKEALGGLEIRTLAASFVFYIPLVRFPGREEAGVTKISSLLASSSLVHPSFAPPPTPAWLILAVVWAVPGPVSCGGRVRRVSFQRPVPAGQWQEHSTGARWAPV